MKAKRRQKDNRVASNDGLGSRANKNTKAWANRFGTCNQWACYYKAVGKHGYCAKHAEFHRIGEEALQVICRLPKIAMFRAGQSGC